MLMISLELCVDILGVVNNKFAVGSIQVTLWQDVTYTRYTRVSRIYLSVG